MTTGELVTRIFITVCSIAGTIIGVTCGALAVASGVKPRKLLGWSALSLVLLLVGGLLLMRLPPS